MSHPALPADFLNRLRRIVGDESFGLVAASFSEPKRTSFRVNTILAETAEVTEQFQIDGLALDALPWCDHAFVVEHDQRDAVTHSPLATDGKIYVQGLSSIFASLVLDPQPAQWNLDLAAAPGGKASHVAALMKNQGKLSVVEPIKKRMYRLADNMKRLGVSISKTYLMDGRKAGQKVPERFDCVLLDAPCSGESRIHTSDPKSYEFWSPRKIKEQSRKQKGLIESAFKCLKPGGTMVYSTCSFAPEENEAIVAHLLDSAGDEVQLQPIEMPFDNWQPGLVSFDDSEFGDQLQHTRRILPNDRFDGFYLAKIKKANF
jgi:16S rRNA (cytosine1407-C5)-methyltransferase